MFLSNIFCNIFIAKFNVNFHLSLHRCRNLSRDNRSGNNGPLNSFRASRVRTPHTHIRASLEVSRIYRLGRRPSFLGPGRATSYAPPSTTITSSREGTPLSTLSPGSRKEGA
jgi:hypothetical protein